MRVSASDSVARAMGPSDYPTAPSVGSAPTAGSHSPSHFAEILRGLGREIDRGEASIRSAVHSMGAGADLGPVGLIALQVGVYRYSEAIDLVSRVVDRATSAVKTVVQGSGQ
jgi:hypothetical protein